MRREYLLGLPKGKSIITIADVIITGLSEVKFLSRYKHQTEMENNRRIRDRKRRQKASILL